jgi:hypothetical protein
MPAAIPLPTQHQFPKGMSHRQVAPQTTTDSPPSKSLSFFLPLSFFALAGKVHCLVGGPAPGHTGLSKKKKTVSPTGQAGERCIFLWSAIPQPPAPEETNNSSPRPSRNDPPPAIHVGSSSEQLDICSGKKNVFFFFLLSFSFLSLLLFPSLSLFLSVLSSGAL